MRIISLDELPDDFRDVFIIKYSDRVRKKKMGLAIERTINLCNEIYKDSEKENHKRYEELTRKAFTEGYEKFFCEFLSVVCQYENLQKKNFADYRRSLIDKLKGSLRDPIIVERIIFYLNNECERYEELTIIIPENIKLPDSVASLKIIRTEDESITLRSGSRAVRFPTGSLCQQWMDEADNKQRSNMKDKASILQGFINSLSAHLPSSELLLTDNANGD